MKIAFIVEGDSEEILIKSAHFKAVMQSYNIEIIAAINVRGEANLKPGKIEAFIKDCRTQAQLQQGIQPDKIIVLADLENDPCVQKAKERIGQEGVDKIFFAKKAIEAWLLADTEAMRRWLENADFPEESSPEATPAKPYERLRIIGNDYHPQKRGPGNKIVIMRKMLNNYGFSIERAARHPNCASLKYFLEKLLTL